VREARLDYWRGEIKDLGNRCFGAPEAYSNMTLPDWRGKLPEPVIEWLKDPSGFLWLYGTVGCGKTHLATACLRRYTMDRAPDYDIDTRPRWFDIQELLEALKPPEPDSVLLERALSAECAVFDDLAAERKTDFTGDRVTFILRQRHMSDLPTIVTSNIGPKELAEDNERLASRLASGARVRMGGKDWRRE
jgi:DNA replication protein DnaC